MWITCFKNIGVRSVLLFLGNVPSGRRSTGDVFYNLGYWLIQIQGKEASGVGGHNVPNVSFAQICYQRMLHN